MVSLLTSFSSIGAYFGELAKNFRATAGHGSLSSFMFLQACGAIFRDDDRPLDGDSSQDTSHFTNELLKRLHEEQQQADFEKPSCVEDLFNVLEGVTVSYHFQNPYGVRG